jgi:hypothetical protein
MKRQFVAVGLAAFALMIFAFITATLAAPGSAPLLQVSETEPNDSFEEANALSIPGYIIGDVSNTPVTETIDYFVMNTTIGREYQASLTVDSPQDLKLRMVLYNGDRGYLQTSSSSSTDTSMSWSSDKDSHYIRVEAVTVSTSTVKSADYRLDIDLIAVTSTPTNTPLPGEDDYEPNNDKDSAYFLPIAASASATDVNFYPDPNEEDWFAFYVKDDRYYRASTSNLIGVDTYVQVYSESGGQVASDNDGGGGFASKAEWTASYDGYYYVRVTNLVDSSTSEDTYDLTVSEISASPTDTPEPGATAIPGADQFEPNFDFDTAATIATDVTYQVNFIPWGGAGEDNDFYKIWIKPGLHFVCETLDLAPGVDTNMIVYDANQNGIAGNDDVELGEYRSRVAYFSTYEGWLYVLVGHGGRLPASELENSDYEIRCEKQVPGQPTATPTRRSAAATATPRPSESPVATPTPAEGLTVRTLTTPTPVPAMTPAPRFVPITLLVYYDGNDDRQPGAGEGIGGISAQAYEVVTNQLLAQGFTDEQGNLEFTVSAQGPVRVSVPFFGFSQLVAGEGASIYLRVPAQPLPGGAP